MEGAVAELKNHGGDVFGTSADVRDYAQIDQALNPSTDTLVMLGYVDDVTYLTVHAVKLTLDRVCTLEDYTLGNEVFRQRCYRMLEQAQRGVLAIHKPNWPTDIVAKPVDRIAQLGNGQRLVLTVVEETTESVVYRFEVAPSQT